MIQLPRDDNFDETLPSGSSYLHGNWLRLMPWSVQQKIAASNGTSYDIDSGVGTLHDGYFGAPRAYGGPYVVNSGTGLQGAAYYGTDSGGTYQDNFLYCSLFRQSEQILNGTASALFQLHEYSGPASTNDSVIYAAVVGRWSGATIDETPATLGGPNNDEAIACGLERHEDGSGYMALIAQNLVTPTQRHIFILRINGGVATVLKDARIVGAGSPFSQYFANPRRLEMKIEGSGTQVAITVKSIGNLPIFVVDDNASAPTQTVLTFTDDSPNRITTPGRWGLGSNATRTVGSGQVTTLIHDWMIRNDGSGATWIDDWTRDPDVRIHAYKTPADPGGVQGRNLQSRYYGDIYSSSNSLSANSLIGISSNQLAYQTSTLLYPLADQIPEASNAASRRSITATFTTPSIGQSRTACIGMRLKARASYTGPTTDYPYRDCFLAFLQVFNVGGGSPYFWTVSVVPVNASGIVPASSTLVQSWQTSTVGLYGTGFGIPLKLTAECFASGASANPTFRVEINDQAVTGFSTTPVWTALGSNYFAYTAATAEQKVGKTWGFGVPDTAQRADNWDELSLSGGQTEAQLAHQLVYVASGSASQARLAHQILFVATDQDAQARVAHQVVFVAHRIATSTNILSTQSASFTFQAGAATLSAAVSLTASAASFFFTAGAATVEATYKLPTLRAEAAGQLVLPGAEAGTIVSAQAEAGQTA